MPITLTRAALTAVLLAAAGTASTAQVIDVDVDELLTEFDLRFMTDNGTPFTLAPGTVFNINDGGRLARVGFLLEQQPYSFGGSTLNINSGGIMDGGSSASDVEMNLHEGGLIDGQLSLFENTTLNVMGGNIGPNLTVFDGSSINVHGGQIGERARIVSGATLTLHNGTIGRDFLAAQNSAVTVNGGSIERGMSLIGGSSLMLNAGNIGKSLEVGAGSHLTIAGGTVGSSLRGTNGSDVRWVAGSIEDGAALFGDFTVAGNNFEINGQAASGAFSLLDTFNGPFEFYRDFFAGTLADGTVFIQPDMYVSGGTLETVTIDPVDTTPMVADSGVLNKGLRDGQNLTALSGSTLGNDFALIDSTLMIDGAQTGERLRVLRSTINVLGDSDIGSIEMFSGSELNIEGGTIERMAARAPKSIQGPITINMSGGELGFMRIGGSDPVEFNYTGGTVNDIEVFDASLNILDGTLSIKNDRFVSVTIGEININGGTLDAMVSARQGATINVMDGVLRGSATLSNSSIIITGGTVEDRFNVSGGAIRVSGGEILSGFSGTVGFDDSGGPVSVSFLMSGGRVDGSIGFDLFEGAATISGGHIAGDLAVLLGNTTISGGQIEGTKTFEDARLDLMVQRYWIDGQLFTLGMDETLRIDQRGGAFFEAILSDGSHFELTLNDTFTQTQDTLINTRFRVIGTIPNPGSLAVIALSGACCDRRRRR